MCVCVCALATHNLYVQYPTRRWDRYRYVHENEVNWKRYLDQAVNVRQREQ